MLEADEFRNQHVIVTGAARGIGLEIASCFGRKGARLTLFDSHAKNLESATAWLSGDGIETAAEQVDISDRRQVDDAVERTEARAGIDILINVAGVAFETPFLLIDEKEWGKVLDVNLTGMFHVCQAVCRHMAERGSGVVVNMASKNGLIGEAGYAHYNSSKAGVIMLTRTMAIELAGAGIRVNAVAPGYIQTPMSMEIDPPEFTERFVERYIPLGRPGSVADVAPLFLFLASDDSRFVTGQVFIVDGGQLAGQKPFQEVLPAPAGG